MDYDCINRHSTKQPVCLRNYNRQSYLQQSPPISTQRPFKTLQDNKRKQSRNHPDHLIRVVARFVLAIILTLALRRKGFLYKISPAIRMDILVLSYEVSIPSSSAILRF